MEKEELVAWPLTFKIELDIIFKRINDLEQEVNKLKNPFTSMLPRETKEEK